MRRRLAFLAALVAVAGCELQAVTVAPPDDVLVVEGYLRTDRPFQFVFLHRTVRGESPARVPGASVVVTDEAGETRVFRPAAIDLCLDGPSGVGSCYVAGSESAPFRVRPGGRYALEVRVSDGRRIAAETRVPGDFRVTRPSDFPCAMPDGPLDITWTASAGTWAYLVAAEMHGLKDALAEEGIVIADDPFVLSGVALSQEDTTLTFPMELGVFERFQLPRELLLALQEGLPDGVESRIVISAADRNFVNWARRSTFNPSGIVRVSSVQGDGIGVFGSLAVRDIVVGAISDPWPTCNGG